MPAYVIVDSHIVDPEAYEGYKAQARPIAEKHGGRYLARGGALHVLETDLWTPQRIVVIEFPDMTAARAFAEDPAYQPVAQIRRQNARTTILIVEGL
ncbi:MAG: DUF1330 domain-containing protein [Pseudomonadota bacterium]